VELALPILKEKNWTSIKVMSDNQTTAYNINRKTPARALIQSTRKFLEMIQKEDLQVNSDHIPGEENQITDSLSRLETAGDYFLQPKVFWKAVRQLKIQTDVDIFASEANHLLSTFGSLRKDSGNPNNLGNALNIIWNNMSYYSSSNSIDQSCIKQIQNGMSGGIIGNPEFGRPEIRQYLRTLNSPETNFRIDRGDTDRGIPDEEANRCSFRKEIIFPSRRANNVPTEKQFSSLYSKPSSLLTPYILLQPEINMGKTIWHLSRDYIKIIKKPNNFSLCTIAFCKELIIKVRHDLETYIFMVIKNSHILSYKYFFLYILQCRQQELCWKVKL
jgi:hypothetical protein